MTKKESLYKKLAMMIGAAAVAATGANAASVTIDSVTQRWPWNNKIDITYTVTDGQTLTSTGNDVYMRLVFNATIGGRSFVIDGVHDIGASANSGTHTVTWTPPADLKVKASDCTMTATLYSADNPSGDDYMVVDLDTGVVSYEGLLYSQELSNDRYTNNAAYKTNKLVLRKVPRGGPYYTQGKTWTTEYDFYVGIFPVTRAQYNKFDSTKTWNYSTAATQTSGYKPADHLCWNTLRASALPTEDIPAIETASGDSFFQLLNCLTGNKYNFDLPTVKMAEIARRAGTSTTYSWGGSPDPDYAAYKNNNDGTTSEVDAHLPNNWGLYDTQGNIWEWTIDYQGGGYATLSSAFERLSESTATSITTANRALSGGGDFNAALSGYNAGSLLTNGRAANSTDVKAATARVYCIMK